jgi:uncharacterized protein YndB with AHSA1/START domain
MESTPVFLERRYPAPIEKLWKAITDGEQMKEWYFDLGDFKAEKGFKFQFTGGDEKIQYLHACEILECEPPNKLSYSWTYPDYRGYSVLTWELFAEGLNLTRLKLSHLGLESFPQEDPNFRRESFMEGWNYFINEALPAFVETSIIKKHCFIDAAAEKIWDIVLHPGNQWGKAFGDGAFVETDWIIGSTVIWTDPGGDIGSKGIVAAHRPMEYLQVDMFDDINAAPDAKPGEYSEKYRLTRIGDRKFELEIECGPLAKKYLTQHGAMWDKAMELIKELSEKQP